MSDLKFYKEIGSVPEDLSSDSLYAVRTGPGFDFYLTDTTGSIAYKLNPSKVSSDPNNILKSTPEGLLVEIEEVEDNTSFMSSFLQGYNDSFNL